MPCWWRDRCRHDCTEKLTTGVTTIATAIEDIVAGLAPNEVKSLVAVLTERMRKSSRETALAAASLLVNELTIAREPLLAEQAQAILDALARKD